MVIIPQRLFDDSNVRTLMRSGNVCILEKKLDQPLIRREGYISNHVVVMLLQGSQRIETYSEEQIRVGAGEVLFIPRGLYYISDLLPAEGPFHSLLFYFDDDLIRQFLSGVKVGIVDRSDSLDFLKLGSVPALENFADNLLEIYRNQKITDKNILPLKILELLHLLRGQVPEKQFAEFLFRVSLPQKRNVRHFMESNFTKPLRVEDYAYLCGRSERSFRRDFKDQFGLSPQQWLQKRRLTHALELLHTAEMPVADLAHSVGYENVSYFIKAFKNKTGLSPKQYLLDRRRGPDIH